MYRRQHLNPRSTWAGWRAAGLVLALTLAPTASAVELTEAPTSPETTAGADRGLALGDFDADGAVDLAVAGDTTGVVDILLNVGGGDFEAAATSPEDGPYSYATSVAAGDVDDDGYDDVAVVDSRLDDLHILIGDGTGDFTSAPTSPEATADIPQRVEMADLNADGNLDVLISHRGFDVVRAYLGDGTGDFTYASGRGVGVNPLNLDTGDFDGDGNVDFAVVAPDSDHVSIQLGDGTGNFTEAPGSPEATGAHPQDVHAADLDGDGHIDLAVTNYHDDTLTILLNDGTGDFVEAAGSPIAMGDGPFPVVSADFDADGHLDLAVSNFIEKTVWVMVGDGAGGFTFDTSLPLPWIWDLATPDVDQDGDPDLVAAGGDVSTGSVVFVYLNGLGPVDTDADGVPDSEDNCPNTANADQADLDGDGSGDVCDADRDGDGVDNSVDNCPDTANASQDDLDADGTGDACDGDRDGDGIDNELDNCPDSANASQQDTDADGLGDACDTDTDGDGVADESDNCPLTANSGQEDLDGDGLGDECDADVDGDGIDDAVDNCPFTHNPGQDDSDADGAGDACDEDDPPAEALGDVIAHIDTLPIDEGIQSSLVHKLENALARLNGGNVTASCKLLGSFEREVSAQRGKKLTTAEADALLADADDLAASLACE